MSSEHAQEGRMSQRECQILGFSEPAPDTQVELQVPLDGQQLSQETVRTYVCAHHRRRFADAGMTVRELLVSR
jgi:hypothetical protein